MCVRGPEALADGADDGSVEVPEPDSQPTDASRRADPAEPEGSVAVTIAGTRHALSPEAAHCLRADLSDALARKRAFLHTSFERRADGTCVISRRRSESAGNSLTFDSWTTVREVYAALPDSFGASEVERPGVTGSRRHLLVRHFAEHPAFSCALVSENPLRAEKR